VKRIEKSISPQATAMAEVALKYAQMGQKGKAEQILAQAIQIAKTTRIESVNKAAVLTAIAIEYAQLGQKDKTD
jgi:Tfp pilus assembly protein PilF